MVSGSSHVWSVVLAGGDGTRLRALTMRPCGTPVPKQFCSLHGGRTLLEDAIERAAGVVERERICAVVAEQHREWWPSALKGIPSRNIFVQPRNRGTGIGVLYSLLRLLALDPEAKVLLLPSDHYVRDEAILRQALRSALARIHHEQDTPVLLGLEPDDVDAELGYILPSDPDPYGGYRVGRFIEKPTVQLAKDIIEAGALWNGFIVAASARAVLDLFTQGLAPLVVRLKVALSRTEHAGLPQAAGWSALCEIYDQFPDVDFSRDILEGRESSLRVIRVPPCGWSDLGTPKRVGETLRRLRQVSRTSRHATEPSDAFIDLAAQHASLERAKLLHASVDS
jgi:mannose-1-phosphate guanylyltransferase